MEDKDKQPEDTENPKKDKKKKKKKKDKGDKPEEKTDDKPDDTKQGDEQNGKTNDKPVANPANDKLDEAAANQEHDNDNTLAEDDKKKKKKEKKKKKKEEPTPEDVDKPAVKEIAQPEQYKPQNDKPEEKIEDKPDSNQDSDKKKKKDKKKKDKPPADNAGNVDDVPVPGKCDEPKDTKTKKKKSKKKDKENLDPEEKGGEKRPKLTDASYEKMLELARTYSRIQTMAREHNMKITDTNDTLSKVEETLVRLEKSQNTYQFIWKIPDFNSHFIAAKKGLKTAIYSPEISSHRYGYKLGISLCPNGDGKGRGSHMSLFFCILKGKYDDILPWPFNCSLRFTVMDQTPTKKNRSADNIVGLFTPNANSANLPFIGKPTSFRNPGLGLPLFAPLASIFDDEQKYLADNTIFIKVEVDLNGLETRIDT